MGHWSESLIDEVARQVGGNPDRSRIMEILGQVGREIDTLSGRSFHAARRTTSTFEPNGLPFVEIPDLQVGSMEPVDGAWPIPDPVNPELAAVLQVASVAVPAATAAPIADALWISGQLLAEASQKGWLSRDSVLRGLGAVDPEQRMGIMRRAMDPTVRFSIPILGVAVRGWWIQISRRLIWVTSETETEGRLLELLLDEEVTGSKPIPLVATEPVLIMAPMTRQPADWAFTARVWTNGVQQSNNRPWAKLAKAIHGHGIPTVTLDPESTPYKIACQLILKGYWHGYIGGNEPALANALAIAYRPQVERIKRETRAPNLTSAAATLLEQLVRPGFDPAQGAEATRRYVRRKASIAIKEHKKRESPDRYPWTQVGISERRYYKLLPLFAQKVNGRYELDQTEVVARMKTHLDHLDNMREVRALALGLLQSRGFGEAAARKWLQRHPPQDAVNAWPRAQHSS
ncbi:hypothetical protein ACEZCY_13230 [Streptacidiphilus sp. N1-12]|uniref:Uncharacterized protein n=2 Tax=Streptacidiphilus alkalitolerans TaxID=3342712 RepID=A0ABV6V925_9ACTN